MTVRLGMGPGAMTGLSIEEYWAWIDRCEARGIDSIWHSDQILGPTLEPMTMLAALSARTRKMRFGTSAIVLPFRDPVVFAKELATIAFLGAGRVFPVVGIGNASDKFWQATGASPKTRGRKSDEAIELIRLLLKEDTVSFAGDHYRYEGPGVQPRPAKPVPLWIGGNSDAAFARTARLGDGWLGSMIGPQRAGEARRSIEAQSQALGRVIEPDHYGMTLMMHIGSEDDPAVQQAIGRMAARMPPETGHSVTDMLAIGPAEKVIAALRRYIGAGISKFVLIPMAASPAALMEQTELLASEVVPAIED